MHSTIFRRGSRRTYSDKTTPQKALALAREAVRVARLAQWAFLSLAVTR